MIRLRNKDFRSLVEDDGEMLKFLGMAKRFVNHGKFNSLSIISSGFWILSMQSDSYIFQPFGMFWPKKAMFGSNCGWSPPFGGDWPGLKPWHTLPLLDWRTLGLFLVSFCVNVLFLRLFCWVFLLGCGGKMVDTNHNRKDASLNWKDRGMIPKKISIRYSISQPSSSLGK